MWHIYDVKRLFIFFANMINFYLICTNQFLAFLFYDWSVSPCCFFVLFLRKLQLFQSTFFFIDTPCMFTSRFSELFMHVSMIKHAFQEEI